MDKCVYTKTIDNENVIISLYVDDMLIFGSSMNIVHSTKYFLASKFDMKDMGVASVILGIKIIRRNNSIMLTQEHYVEKLLKNFGHFDVKPLSTPYDANSQLKKNKDDVVSQLKYAQIIGSLMHLINFTWPDIAYVVCRLGKDIHKILIISIGQR